MTDCCGLRCVVALLFSNKRLLIIETLKKFCKNIVKLLNTPQGSLLGSHPINHRLSRPRGATNIETRLSR